MIKSPWFWQLFLYDMSSIAHGTYNQAEVLIYTNMSSPIARSTDHRFWSTPCFPETLYAQYRFTELWIMFKRPIDRSPNLGSWYGTREYSVLHTGFGEGVVMSMMCDAILILIYIYWTSHILFIRWFQPWKAMHEMRGQTIKPWNQFRKYTRE